MFIACQNLLNEVPVERSILADFTIYIYIYLYIYIYFFYRKSLNKKLNGSMKEIVPNSDQKAQNSRQRVKTHLSSP